MNASDNIKIMVVEDDKQINTLINKILIKEGFDIVQAYDGRSAMDNFQYESQLKLIVLDLMIPFIDGFEIIRRIRQKSTVPILVISAKNTEVDKISAISMGADDYIVKPFSVNEFVVRVKALLRRYIYFNNEEVIEQAIVNYKDLVIDVRTYTITKKDEIIKTTPLEFEIFKLFLQNPKRVFTKSHIYDSVWGKDIIRNDNTVMVHIKRLRDKLGEDEENCYISTVWGIGYKLGE